MFAKSKQLRVTTIIPSCLKYLSEERWLMVSLGDTRFSGAAELWSAPADCILLYSLHYQQWLESEAACSMSLFRGISSLSYLKNSLISDISPLGWRDGSAVKSACSCTGPVFGLQHTCGGLQPLELQLQETRHCLLTSPGKHRVYIHTCRQNTNTCKIIETHYLSSLQPK